MINKLKELRETGSEEGFTLIELMIVVVIIGILAAIAIPIFMNQQKAAIVAGVKSDVKNTVTNVATALVKAPTAVSVTGAKTGTGTTTGTITGGFTFEIVVSDAATTVLVAGAWNTYKVYGENISVSGSAAAPTAIPATFTPADGKVYYDSVTGKTK